MAFTLSAGVYFKETDLSFVAEQFVGSKGCYAGKFMWGPSLQRVIVDREETLANIFGKPTSGNIDNVIDWHVANQFLNYSNALDVVRIASFNGTSYLNKNSVVRPYFNNLNASGTAEPDITILNDEHYTNLLDGDLENNGFVGRFTGAYGNSVGISWVVNSNNTVLTSQLNTNGFYDDLSTLQDNFVLTRNKTIKFLRPDINTTIREYLDILDWLDLDSLRYQVKNITLGTSANSVLDVTVVSSGLYQTTPTVNFSGAGSTLATATAVLSTSIGVVATNAGAGYDNGDYDLLFSGGSGNGAAGFVTISSGTISSITITNSGTGYTGNPTIAIDYTGNAPSTTAVLASGRPIENIIMTNNGSYTTLPTVAIAGAVLTGVGATVTVTNVNVATGIDEIEIDRIYSGTVSTGNYLNGTNNTSIPITKYWRFSNVISTNPISVSNGIHVIIFDNDGKISGQRGTILEQYKDLSLSTTAKNEDGTSNYWSDRINTNSYYVRLGTKDISTWTQTIDDGGKTYITNYLALVNGDDAFTSMGLDDDIAGYDLFKDPEQTDAPIIIGNYRSIKNNGGLPDSVLATYLIQNIAEVRKDSMVYVSCRRESVVNNPRNEVRELLKDVATLPSTSYGEMDSGWKYIYDRYNDKYVWIPTCADHAGAYARTDSTNDAWFSAAGQQRGIIKNVIKLAFNPNEAQRDQLYPNRINPIVTFPNVGTMIYGDKTLLNLNSAFNRIPTRRLFIVLEKTLTRASRFALFEFNDAITRAQARNICESYLSEVKSKRGVDDYRVIIDETNNTSAVIEQNQLKGTILIKPNYSINFIELNFVAVNQSTLFEEALTFV